MNRAAAVSYLGPRFNKYLTEVGRTAVDSTGNLKEPIDDALLALGYASAELPTADTSAIWDDDAMRLQLEYRLLLQLTRDLAINMDVRDDTGGASLSQIRKAAEADLETAKQAVLARFSTLGTVSGEFQFTALDLGIVPRWSY
jgi:hypothetical protein